MLVQLCTHPSRPTPVLEKCFGFHAGSWHPITIPLASRIPSWGNALHSTSHLSPLCSSPPALQRQWELINSSPYP